MAFEPIGIKPGEGKGYSNGVPLGRTPLSAITETFVPDLLGYLEEGMGFRAACDLVGVSATAVRNMVKAGKQDQLKDNPSKLAEFAIAVTMAMAKAKQKRINQLNKAAENPMAWTAAAWWLERMYPEEFGKQDRLAITMNKGAETSATLASVELSEEEADTLGEILGRIADTRGDENAFDVEESLGLGQGDESEWNE